MSASTMSDATADRLKRLGGTVYVPPTDSNIGRIAVVADPQTATLALVKGLKPARQQPAEPDKPGRVGWHELLAADWEKAFAFYSELFGWQKADAEIGPTDDLSVVLRRRTRRSAACSPSGRSSRSRSGCYYFNVGDIDAAAERVKTGGGQIFEGPLELPDGSWIARCRDPQGAVFALQGKRSQEASRERRLRKSAGPPNGAAFRREAGWWSPSRAAGAEPIRVPSVRSRTPLDQPAFGRRSAGFGAAGFGRLVLPFRPGDVVGDRRS